MEFKYLHTFDNVYELDLVRARFRAENIQFIVDDEFVTQIGYGVASGGAKIRIAQNQWALAKAILKELNIKVDQRQRLSKWERKLLIYADRLPFFEQFNLLELKLIVLFIFAVLILAITVPISLI